MGESADFIATVRKAYTILTKYDVNDPSDFPYDDAMAALVSLESEPYTEDTTADTSSATTSSVKATQYNKAMVYYYEYYVSVICNKDNDEQLKYLEKIKEEYPSIFGFTVRPSAIFTQKPARTSPKSAIKSAAIIPRTRRRILLK